jgi:hypothetical protein
MVNMITCNYCPSTLYLYIVATSVGLGVDGPVGQINGMALRRLGGLGGVAPQFCAAGNFFSKKGAWHSYFMLAFN